MLLLANKKGVISSLKQMSYMIVIRVVLNNETGLNI